jgi:neutral ceramidase
VSSSTSRSTYAHPSDPVFPRAALGVTHTAALRTKTKIAAVALTIMISATGSFFAYQPEAVAEPSQKNRGLRAGAAASNITPPLGVSINGYFNDRTAAYIHDELHARCLVLDDGQTRLAIVVCDSCMIPRETLDAAKRRIQQKSGLAADHILISSTHTHTAPTSAAVFQSEPNKEYSQFLTARIADGVARAIHNLAPAKIAWGAGNLPDQVFNRRWKMKPGTIPPNPLGGTNDLVKMNPAIGSPDLIEPAGPTDPQVSVLSVQSPEGRPIALLANYSLHYVGTSQANDISADYFGAFADRIQQLLGADRLDPPFVALLSNGTSGNINNIDFRVKPPPKGPYEQIHFVADLVAREAQRVCQTLHYHQDEVRLGVQQTEIKLGVRLPSKEDVSRAEAILAKVNGRSLRTGEECYARETVLMKNYPPAVPLIIQALRIGDLAIAAIPCEVFAETGLAIKRQSPFKQTFTIELANGCSGYIPTPEQHRLGGYETWRARSSFLEVEAAPKILDTLMTLFARLNQ